MSVAWDTPTTGQVVEFLFGDVPGDPPPAEQTRSLSLVSRHSAGAYLLRHGDDVLWRGRSIGGLAAALLDEVQRDLAGRARGGAMFHAAAVARGGRTLLLPGDSGAGKTSLCAWLLHRGWSYLTDELVYVESASQRIQFLPRPLHVKRNGIAAVEGLLPVEALKSVRVTPSGLLVPHRLFNPEYRSGSCEIGLILLPRFDASAFGELQPLGRAEAGRRLMSCLINARNLEAHGFSEATRLASAHDTFALTYGGYVQLGSALDALLDRHFAS